MNTTTNISGNITDCSEISNHIQILVSISYLIFGLVAVLGNAVVIVALNRSKLIKTGGYLTLAHFCLTDLTTGLIDVLYTPWAIMFQNTFGLGYQLAVVITFSAYARKCFNVFMAATQFFSINFPMKARRLMSQQWYKRAILVTWFSSVLVSAPIWIGQGYYFELCSHNWAFNENTRGWISMYGLIVNILVTLVIIFAYPFCFMKLYFNNNKWKREKLRRKFSRLSGSKSYCAYKEKKILILYFLDACVFILYWLPVYLTEIWRIEIVNIGLFQEIIRGIDICYNPLAYLGLNYNIRLAVKRLFKPLPKRYQRYYQKSVNSFSDFNSATTTATNCIDESPSRLENIIEDKEAETLTV